MSLLADFFTIKEHRKEEKAFIAAVEINPEHAVFEGHFPGNPVVPGVCMIEMIRTVLEMEYNKTFQLSETKNAKFLNILNPRNTPGVEIKSEVLEASGNTIRLRSVIYDKEIVFLKMEATFKEIGM